MLSAFFAPQGRFEPCGMFTLAHIAAALICVLCVITALYFTRSRFIDNKFLKLTAIAVTVLELIKISHSVIYGDHNLDAWFPLSYCGLFIFTLWMAGFCKGRAKRIGEVFIAYGCPIAGVIFLIFPTTSLMIFPIWHYFSIYSLLFHSLMIFVGIFLLKKEKFFGKREFLYYGAFVLTFSIPAFVLNCIFGSNLMNLREPFNIPIEFFQNLYTTHPLAYSGVVIVTFMLIPVVTAMVAGRFKKRQF